MPAHVEEMLEAMQKPGTYDERVDAISMVQTHISWVFLTGDFAYKIKKPVNFGFLDFTTLEKRKRFCDMELKINSMFSPEIYIGVVPLKKSGSGLRFSGAGETIEYAIKMRQLPQEGLMNRLLDRNEIKTDVMDKIVAKLADFYARTRTSTKKDATGSLATVEFNWKENFEQTLPFIGKTLGQETFDTIKQKAETFMTNNERLFARRVRNGQVKWCHGDLHSGNIFVINGDVYIFDAIEFNERFACSDVASDVAFLCMDLDFRHRSYLSDYFVKKYVEESGDSEMQRLLDFYKCYRAYVRGKVIGFRLNDPHIPEKEKQEASDTARLYFQLAMQYAKNF